MKDAGRTEIVGQDPTLDECIVETWYRAHRDDLVRLLERRWKAAADDAVQDVFIEIYRNPVELSRIKNPPAWLYSRALNRLRNKYHKDAWLTDHIGEITATRSDNNEPPIGKELMEFALEKLDHERKDVATALGELIENGFSDVEASSRLCISRRTVSRWRKSFLAKLRDLICHNNG